MTAVGRVTQLSVYPQMLSGLESNLASVQKLEEELSSGKAINQPSDNPIGTVQSMQLSGQAARSAQYSRNANDGLSWLNLTDSTLTSGLNQLQRVRQLILEGMNATSDSTARSAQATEVDGIFSSMLGLANTTNGGRPLFGGNTAGATAYDSSGTYVGDAGAVVRTIAPGQNVQVNVNGPAVFGNMFGVLKTISADLTSGDTTALGNDLNSLDAVRNTIQTQLSSVGAKETQVQNAKTAADDNSTTIAGNLSAVEDVDMAQAITQLNSQQVAYQAALSATSKIITQSLVTFLQ